MSCGCNNCGGLNGIPSEQVNALQKYVLRGTIVEWGGHIERDSSTWDWDKIGGWGEDNNVKIMQNLSRMGLSPNWVTQCAGFTNPYICITGTATTDFSRLGDVLAIIEGAIYQSGYFPDSQNFWVKSVPASAGNRSDVAQPNAGTGSQSTSGGWKLPNIFGGGNPQNQPVQSPNCPEGFYDASIFGGAFGLDCRLLPLTPDPVPCNWDAQSIGDYIACQLGIKPSEAAVVGVVAALIGVIALKKFL